MKLVAFNFMCLNSILVGLGAGGDCLYRLIMGRPFIDARLLPQYFGTSEYIITIYFLMIGICGLYFVYDWCMFLYNQYLERKAIANLEAILKKR